MLVRFRKEHAIRKSFPSIVTQQLLAGRCNCNVDLQMKDGFTAMQVALREGHFGIATLIRSTKPKGGVQAVKDTLLQASPEEIKRQ